MCNANLQNFFSQVEKRNKVSSREAESIEKRTRGQHKNVQWKEERAWRITASMYAFETRLPLARCTIKDILQATIAHEIKLTKSLHLY
jgi:hypothetical protein